MVQHQPTNGPMSASSFHLDSYDVCHQGLVRKINEDSVIAIPPQGLWAVADGMGGHSKGDFASQAITRKLSDLTIVRGLSLSSRLDQVENALRQVNSQLLAASREISADAVVGSTIVAMITNDTSAGLIWAGDSRAYRLRGRILERLTTDHNVANELVEKQGLPRAAAESADDAEALTMAVGTEFFAPERRETNLLRGDIFCLCSDGITKLISDDEIADVLASDKTAESLSHALLDQALGRGATDNISLIIIKVS